MERNIKLNGSKFRLKASSLPYVGHVLTPKSLKPDPKKIIAIQHIPTPTDVHGVRRLFGVMNYLARFLPNLADICHTFRQLTKKDTKWQWTETENTTFEEVKKAIISTPVLRFFDPKLPATIQNDASSTGLGAVLLQKGQSVAYANCSLKPNEKHLRRSRRSCWE